MNNRAGISLQINTSTLELFVFCLDHDTNELFDGLTDRPVSYLKSTQQIREIETDVFLAKKRQTMPSGGLSRPTPEGMVATRNTYSHLAVRQNTTGELRRSDAQTKLERLHMMVKGIMGNDPVVQTKCTFRFRRLLSRVKNPQIQNVIDAGVVPRFVEFLKRDDNPMLQFEAAWALTNITAGTSDHTKAVMEAGAVPIFVRLLSSPNDDVREQAIWVIGKEKPNRMMICNNCMNERKLTSIYDSLHCPLPFFLRITKIKTSTTTGNIAGDSPTCRDLVLQAGAMQPLLQQLRKSANLTILRYATWTLSNFCRGKPKPDFKMVQPSLPTLSQLMFSLDDEVLKHACWALSYLSDGPNENIQAVIDVGVCPRRLVKLLLNPSPAVQTPALSTVGNIVTGNDLQTQLIINSNALPCLL
jgi:importin subunit alpha-1